MPESLELLIEKYGSAFQDITSELKEVKSEQSNSKTKLSELLRENNNLRKELEETLARDSAIELRFNENDFAENLKQQLSFALREKDYVTELWQNAVKTVDHLEGELQVYQDNTQGFIPKSQLQLVKSSYEEKLKTLEEALVKAQSKFDELSRNIQLKDREIDETHQIHGGAFKIVKNLEDEVLKLQRRIETINEAKEQLEGDIKRKNEEIARLRLNNKECQLKVQEAVQVVEAALNEKDAALLREQAAAEQLAKLSQSLSEIIPEANEKVKNEIAAVKAEHEAKLEKFANELKTSRDELKIKALEIESYVKESALLKKEIDSLRALAGSHHQKGDETVGEISRLLVLEKNLENTFQKLLLSEKANIQIKAENESVKNDLEQMARYYERDVYAREAEKVVMTNEVKRLKIQVEETAERLARSRREAEELDRKVAEAEVAFRSQLEEIELLSQKTLEDMREAHRTEMKGLQEQLVSLLENNKKWRSETANITEKMEKRITDLKVELNKLKNRNKALSDKLKEAGTKIFEYRKFMDVISQDVNKITSITLHNEEAS